MSVVFDSTADYLVNFTSSFGITSYPLTVGLWLKITTTVNDSRPFGITNDNGNGYFFIARMNTGPSISARQNQSGFVTSGEVNTSTGVWVPWIFKYQGALTRAENDSASAQATTSVTYQTNSSPRSFIGSSNSGTKGITGKIAHFVVWDVDLASGDVTDFLNAKDPANIDSANQTRYWPFPGDGASDLTDEIVSEVLSNTGVTYDNTDNPTISSADYSTNYKLIIT